MNEIGTSPNGVTRARYRGPRLKLRYTDAEDLTVLHSLRMGDGYSVLVVGNPENGSYEWVIARAGKLDHSDCGYGDSDIALRDGLIAMHGLPRPQRREYANMINLVALTLANSRAMRRGAPPLANVLEVIQSTYPDVHAALMEDAKAVVDALLEQRLILEVSC